MATGHAKIVAKIETGNIISIKSDTVYNLSNPLNLHFALQKEFIAFGTALDDPRRNSQQPRHRRSQTRQTNQNPTQPQTWHRQRGISTNNRA